MTPPRQSLVVAFDDYQIAQQFADAGVVGLLLRAFIKDHGL
jgi:hypothetical protein